MDGSSFTIGRMVDDALYPRLAQSNLLEGLDDSPVVLIHGARQCGKTTLAQMVGATRGYRYFSFDDDVVRAAGQSDPKGFVGDLPQRVILDEIQRAPALLGALKMAVDRDRTPGRFLLTGSSNLMLLPTVADSLAGRMEILRLFPLAQVELARHRSGFIEALFANGFTASSVDRLKLGLAERIVAGGFPAALARSSHRRRRTWYRDYIGAIVQRDVRDLANISSGDAIPRLLALAAGQTARLLNVADLAAPFRLSRPTIRHYLSLLIRLFLVDEVPPWHSNRLTRLIKTPKLHLGDSGLACALLGHDPATLYRDRAALGQLLETFVYQELKRQASFGPDEIRFYHFRDKDGVEVDLVLERGGHELVGVDVKASATVTGRDFRGLRKLAEASDGRFVCGIVLYDGDLGARFGDRLHAVPIRALWEETVPMPGTAL